MRHFTVILKNKYISLKAENHAAALKKARSGSGKVLDSNLPEYTLTRVQLGFMTYAQINEAQKLGRN